MPTISRERRHPGGCGLKKKTGWKPSLPGLTPVRRFVFFYFFKRVGDKAGVEFLNGQSSSLREVLPTRLEILLLQYGITALQTVKKSR